MSVPPEQRAVLERLVELLLNFGIANDAEDHHCREEAEELRRDGTAGIRGLVDRHAFLADVLPGLRIALERENLGLAWSSLSDAAEKVLGGPKVRYPYWTVLRVKTGMGEPEYGGSKETGSFASLEDARASAEGTEREEGEALLVVQVRSQWSYFMPDGRRFSVSMGDSLRQYLPGRRRPKRSGR
jgi:hypothetical protein